MLRGDLIRNKLCIGGAPINVLPPHLGGGVEEELLKKENRINNYLLFEKEDV